jgi:CHAT domain-containing protein
MVERAPRSLDGYACLLPYRGTHRPEVLGFLDRRLRHDPHDPRPRLYRAIVLALAGGSVEEREWLEATEGFAREHEVTGEFYALTSHVSARCIGPRTCDDQVMSMLWRAGELARASGKLPLQQQLEVWRMKVAFATDDLAAAEAAEARLLALGEPASAWLRSESLQARAHRAFMVRDYAQERELYRQLLDLVLPEDPRRAVALGGRAAASAHLALQGLESRAAAERLVREALAAEERAGVPLWYQDIGTLPSRVQLALLLGPTPESFGLLRSVLGDYRARERWTSPMFPQLALAELLALAQPARLEEALGVADEAVQDAFRVGNYEQVRSLLMRSRLRLRLGQFSLGRSDGLAALDRAEQLREHQGDIPVRLRYAESLSFAYRSLSGALVAYRAPGDDSAIDDAFQVMERFRARGLMETLLVEDRSGPLGAALRPLQPPTLAQVRAQLAPEEALLSFQVWRTEPTMDAPYFEGSSWVTVVTSSGARAFRIPDAEVLEAQARAWTGLLDRRDGSDRAPAARLHDELLGAALASLPRGIERLIVIPDGPLHRLPFDALSAGLGSPYLAERFAVSIAPSAALWLRFRAAPRQPPGRILVLADPSDPSARRAVRRDGVFGALVHARREAEVALSAFPPGSELRTGPPASESFLKSASLKGVSLVHFATHAVTDTRDPEHAAVVLAPGSPAEDGRLEPREIARLPLAGKTVVLAGCETSAGPVFRGEGVMSLARAFFSAGATAVVGTLDRERDDEAGRFFTAMYGSLGRGASIGEAVVAAKREAIRHGSPAAAWAGVVVLGDAQARPRGGEPLRILPLVFAAGALVFVGFGAGRWWRRGSHRLRDEAAPGKMNSTASGAPNSRGPTGG